MSSEENQNHNQDRSLKRRVAGWCGFVLVQGLLVLLLLEIIGRLFDPLGISYYPETARFLDTMIKEEPIGYRCQPNLSGRFHDATYTLNSLGLRDDEITNEKNADEKRILILGDSHIFGIGVDDEDCIPSVAERIANEQSNGRLRFQFINMGVPSYNTEQELIQLRSLGMSLNPDGVVLRFSKNDIESKMWVFEKRQSFGANLAQRSYATCLLFSLRRMMRQKTGREQALVNVAGYRDGHPRWSAVHNSLVEINQICVKAGIPFLVLVPERLDQEPYRMLAELAESEGFRIDALVPGDDERWSDLDPSKLRNSRTDSHANKEGCRIVGTLMCELMVQHGLVAEPDADSVTVRRVSVDPSTH